MDFKGHEKLVECRIKKLKKILAVCVSLQITLVFLDFKFDLEENETDRVNELKPTNLLASQNTAALFFGFPVLLAAFTLVFTPTRTVSSSTTRIFRVLRNGRGR